MEVRNWKKVLLHWIQECGFVPGNYFSLEQTDIDEFYNKFRMNHKLVKNTAPEGNLIDFLKDQYADYTPLLDAENTLNTTEYIYAYSLLLHFSCVKYPETNFHDICKRLSVNNQRYIAAFFNELLDCQSISRDKLLYVIASTSLKCANTSGGSGNDSHSSGNNSTGNNFNLPSSSYPRMSSPCRTSRNASGSSSPRMVPPTPKSAMLEERTRELYNLRAQLETERYEKGLLEVQIKQNEDKIRKLNQDHKKLQQTIQDLRNDILTQSTESSSPSKDGEQMKRRLCRELTLKEAEIANLTETLGNLNEEKSLVQEKLSFADKKIVVCMERIALLDFKVDELTAELEQKEQTIKYLNENKLELEQFINETRSAGNCSRPDYLEASFSPITDASGSSTSPENLARSVVDVQLREKEHENAELREELDSLKNSNKRLADLIRTYTLKHAQELNISTIVERITAKEQESIEFTPFERLDHLVEFVDHIGMLFKDEKGKAETLQADLQAKQRRNDELSRRLMEFEKEIAVLNKQLNNLNNMNMELEQGKKRMHEKLGRYEQENVKIKEQNFAVVDKLESLAKDYDTYKNKCAAQHHEFTAQIRKLENDVEGREKTNSSLKKVNDELNVEVVALRKKLETLQQSLTSNSDEIRILNERVKGYQSELEAHDKTEKMLKEKYEKILVQHEATKRDRRETADHLEAMRNKIAVKEFEMGKIGAEIIEVRKKNVELETRIDTLTTEFKTEKHNSELAINSRDERIRKISEERDKLEECANKLKSEQELAEKELKASKEDLGAALKTFNALAVLFCADETDASVNLAQKLGDVVANAKRLHEDKLALDSKLELMSAKHSETVSKMVAMEDDMKNLILAKEELEINYKALLEQSELKLNHAEAQLKIYEEDIENMKEALKQVTAEMENSLQSNIEDHTARVMELGVEHDHVVNSLREELNSAKVELCAKEHELQTLLEESREVKKKLDESVQRLEAVQQEQTQIGQSSAEKLKALEEQMEVVVGENKKLLQEIDCFKAEHAKVNAKIDQADNALNDINGQLLQEVNSNHELCAKLKASESRLYETEQKLESILKEKSNTINGLKTAYESQTAVLKRSESQLNALEKSTLKQTQSIATLQQSLQKAIDEKERLAKDFTSVSSQMQREQEEKSALLASLEQTADQLKIAICEKDQKAIILEKSCAELNNHIRDANELCAKLQTDLSEKEALVQRMQEEQEHERDNWQTKFSEMMRMLTEQSVEQENIDSILQQITAAIENHNNLAGDGDKMPEVVDECFKVAENDKDTLLGKLRIALNRLLHGISHLHTQLDQIEQKRQGAVEVLEKANDKLNSQLLSRNAEITELQQQLVGERKRSALTDSLKSELHNLKDAREKLKSQVVQLEHESAIVKEQHQNAAAALERLQQEKAELKMELQRANENVTRLIQGSDTLRQEKDSLVEQLQELRQQLTQTSAQHSSTESMVKNILQNSTTLERKLDSTEKELKLLRAQLQTLESKKEELAAENVKLRESQEASKKRIEKISIKLGDTQARCSKVEHENEKLNESLNASKVATEKLKREKTLLENEKQTLQRSQQQLINKVNQLEQIKTLLETEKKKLETAEADATARLTKLDKNRQLNEEKIRKLNYSLETTEASNVRLNHEIGAINSELNKLRQTISADRTAEDLEKAIHERDEALARAYEFEALAQKLQTDAQHLQEQNSNINDQLAKISLALQISQEKCEALDQQLRNLAIDMCALKEEKVQIETEHLYTCAKLKEYEINSDNLRSERDEKVLTLEAEAEQLRKELCRKTDEISTLQGERDSLRNGNKEESVEVVQLRERLHVTEALAESEKKANAQLRIDNQIFQAKYQEIKQRLQASEERIKENRLEMEGKLEKMKNKMEGPHSLDDSMSALLSTTSGGGARKKLTGITNYKRPGPPTPSKHGGRLSLGSSEPPREILKEVNLQGGSSAKTPVRFGFFASKFSMGHSNSRDETAKLSTDLLKVVQQKNFQAMCLKSRENICTSTPRKSQSHFDRRCLFNQIMALSGSSMVSLTVEKDRTVNAANAPPTLSLADISGINHAGGSLSHLKMLEQQRIIRKRRTSLLRLQIGRQLKHLPNSSKLSSETPSTGTPQTPTKNKRIHHKSFKGNIKVSGTTTSTTSVTSATATTTTTTASSGDVLGRKSGVGGRHSRRHKRDRGPRLSLYACGSSYRTPNRNKLREQMRKKAHKQRRDNFNLGRAIEIDNRLTGGSLDFDSVRVSEEINDSHSYQLNATIVLSEKCDQPEAYDIPEYTSNYFSEIVAGSTEIIEEGSAEGVTLSPNCFETNISSDRAYNSNDTQSALDEKTKRNHSVNSVSTDVNTTTYSIHESDYNNESTSSSLNITLPVDQNMEHEAVDEPSTLEEIEEFDARYKHFAELASQTESAAPFVVSDVDLSVVALPPHSQQAEKQNHSITYTMAPNRATMSVGVAKALNMDEQNCDDREVQITLVDVVRLWSSLWARMDQQLQLTVFLVIFAPLIALIYVVFSS
ncbi:GRIP and coiled-coil domain-containing protein 2 isoform X2 [Anastrepha ludens]|uniref:GRIP and coiled-coil domain-containing protein 2 isoform X2 n=1 Tax=Anastrepha ludens TaxID=28586 RepID=UPI0023B05704|nr:GRIP and coiled-coil domain-containing protein 2 isoform X2 [Anastrepha ludens]